jgi:hypothetical protein
VGPDLINIYNDAYIPMLGRKHPAVFGQSAAEVWAEIWDVVGPQANLVINNNQATWNQEMLLVMERYGYKEELILAGRTARSEMVRQELRDCSARSRKTR